MADGLTTQSATPATIPATTKVATDDTGSAGHVQIIKLAIATDGSATLIPADATDGLLVKVSNPTAITGGGTATHQQITSSGLTTATTAYAIGDTLGAGWSFTGMPAHGRIRRITLLDEGDVLTGVDLWFTSASVTFGTDNAAPSISDADARKIVAGPVTVPVYDLGANRVGSIHGTWDFSTDAGTLVVYATTLSANAVFTAVGDLKLALQYETT